MHVLVVERAPTQMGSFGGRGRGKSRRERQGESFGGETEATSSRALQYDLAQSAAELRCTGRSPLFRRGAKDGPEIRPEVHTTRMHAYRRQDIRPRALVVLMLRA
eukprot:4072009-Pleurochrysis_carterae.AAC.1